jgi:hypothetical protein
VDLGGARQRSPITRMSPAVVRPLAVGSSGEIERRSVAGLARQQQIRYEM